MTTPSQPIGQARIRIRPDFSGFREKVREETDGTTSKPATIPVKGDTTEAKAKLAELRADLDRLRAQTATAKVALDGDAKAQRQIDRIDLSLRRLGLVTARPKVSVEGVERAKIQIDDLQARLAALSATSAGAGAGGRGRGGGSTTGGFLAGAASHAPSSLALALGLATPLAVPFTGAALGGAASFLTPSVAGGIGLGAFGVAAKQNISSLQKTQEQYDKLQQKLANTPQTVTTSRTTAAASPAQITAAQQRLDAARLRLATAEAATKQNPTRIAGAEASVTSAQASLTRLQGRGGTTTTTKDNKEYQKLLKQERDLLKTLDPAQRQAIKNVDALDDAWKNYKKALEPQSFKALADGAKIGTTGLGLLLPVAKAVGDEVDLLEKRVQVALTQPFWRDFFHTFLATEAPRAVDTLGTVIGNTLTGIGHLSEGFAPLGHDLEGLMTRTSARFEHWTEGEGPGRFVAWVEKNGPQVAKTIEALASGVEGIAKGLSPIAAVELKALTPVLNFIGDLGDSHPEVITALGVALLGVGAGLKVIAGVKGVTGVIASLKGLGKGGILGGGGGVLGGVTERGGSPANPVYVFVVDQAPGGGGLPTPGGGKGKGGGKSLPIGLGIPLTAAYLATQGGDQAAGQNGPPLSQRHNPYAQLFALRGGKDFPKSDYIDNKLDLKSAVQTVMTSGTPGQVQQLQALAKQYPQIAAAVKDLNAQQSTLNRYLAVNTGLASANGAAQKKAVSDVIAQLKNLPGAYAQAEAQAQAAGQTIGQALADGLTIGIKHGNTINLTTTQVVDGVKHVMHNRLEIGSPSKLTMRYGKWLAQGLEIGFTGYTGTLLKSFDKATLSVLGTLGGNLSKAADQYRTDLQGRTDLKASVAQNIMGAASIGNATLSNTGGATVSGFLAGQIRTDKTFDGLLKQLRKRGLDPRLVQQVEDAFAQNPGQGTALAQQILASGQVGIRRDNAQERTLGALSQSIGGTVANSTFAGTLGRDQKALEKAAAALDRLVTKKLDLSPHAAVVMERAMEQAIRKAFPSLNVKELDAVLGLKIANAT